LKSTISVASNNIVWSKERMRRVDDIFDVFSKIPIINSQMIYSVVMILDKGMYVKII
jgi:hypothetical protein